MNPDDFQPGFPGKLVPTEFHQRLDGPNHPAEIVKTHAFIPDPLPPDLDWRSMLVEHFDLHSATISALGNVNGLHKRMGRAAGLLRTLWMREAKLSSEIENIDTTAEEMVLAGAGRTLGVRQNGRESWNYVRALEHGIDSERAFSVELICKMHELLLADVRGEQRKGKLREKGVYIGDKSRGARRARFVPMPAGDALEEAMRDLESFVNTKHERIPPLFVIALTHYQFETIHPFGDGNGRIGRVLISRSLVKEGLLMQPVVYMSAYINANKREYVDLLLGISQQGGDYWSRWIAFVLNAIRTQAHDAIWRSEELISLRENYHEALKAQKAPSRQFEIVDDLFNMPAINPKEIEERTGVRKPTASKDVATLEELGILREYTGKLRDRDWVAPQIIRVIEAVSPTQPTD